MRNSFREIYFLTVWFEFYDIYDTKSFISLEAYGLRSFTAHLFL